MPIADWLPYPSPFYINIGLELRVSVSGTEKGTEQSLDPNYSL